MYFFAIDSIVKSYLDKTLSEHMKATKNVQCSDRTGILSLFWAMIGIIKVHELKESQYENCVIIVK